MKSVLLFSCTDGQIPDCSAACTAHCQGLRHFTLERAVTALSKAPLRHVIVMQMWQEFNMSLP